MSHGALASVTVRMRFDPAFTNAVYDSPALALRGEDLSDEEIGWIVAVDRRAWSTDPLLRARTLRTLCEEARGASTLALAELRRLSALDAYFSSPQFHAALRERGSMFGGFIAYLRSLHLRAPQLAPVLALEEALGLARRELELSPERLERGRGLVRAPGVGALVVDGCALEVLNAVERYLFEVSLLPAMALCTDAPRLPPLPPMRPEAPLHLVLQPAAGGSGITELGRNVCAMLAALHQPRPLPEALRVAEGLGLSRGRAESLLSDLRQESLIVDR